MRLIDLRSDTVTLPSPAMRAAMAAAEVGDDVYGEDPSVNALEEADIAAAIRADNIHYPRTTLLCLENTHNRAGGTVYPLERLVALRRLADNHTLPVHLDGAQICNAAVALGVPVG